MDINAYLKRIKYSSPRAPTAETLRKLHRAQVLTIPFENLDVHLGCTIVLDEKNYLKRSSVKSGAGFATS